MFGEVIHIGCEIRTKLLRVCVCVFMCLCVCVWKTQNFPMLNLLLHIAHI